MIKLQNNNGVINEWNHCSCQNLIKPCEDPKFNFQALKGFDPPKVDIQNIRAGKLKVDNRTSCSAVYEALKPLQFW